MSNQKRKKELVTDGDPEAVFALPTRDNFADEEFVLAPDLARIGEELIAGVPELSHLESARIVYLFKKKGPKKPERRLGECRKPGGLLAHFSNADFCIVLMANNCVGFTKWQVEALVYHELKHAGIGENGDWKTQPHDCECFAQEIERYGLWKSDLAKIAQASDKAMQLPFELGIERGTSEAADATADGAIEAIAEMVKPIGKGGITSMSISTPGQEPVVIDRLTAHAITETAKDIKAKRGKPEARA